MAELTPEQIAKLRAELDQLNEAKQKGLDYDKERLTLLNNYINAQKTSLTNINQEIANLEAYQEKLKGLGNTMEANLLKRETAKEILQQQIRLNEELLRSGTDVSDEIVKTIAKQKEQLEKQETILSVQKEMNKDMRQTTSLVQAAEKAAAKMALTFQSPTMALGQLNVGLQKLGGFLTGKFIDGMVGMITSFDEASKAFETNYAVGEQYRSMVSSIYGEQAQLGVSMEEITKASGDLIDNFTDFTMLLPAQQEQLAKTATIMQESYGIATADTAKIVQSSTKMLGMGVNEASRYAGELAETAKALGVAPAQLSAKFAQMGPQLAKFGQQGGKAFKELARISKITGMEMEKVLAITNKFDTFEGAAEQAGQLNAALGGNFVNAMDLMMATDPAERFNMIRDSILDTGLTFDTMSYYQKQFYTNSLGLSDVGDLALMLSGNMDNLAGSGQKSAKQYEEQAERAKSLMTIQEKLSSIFLESADQVEFLAKKLSDLATFLQNNGKTLLYVAGALQLLNAGWAIYKARKMWVATNAIASLATGAKEVASTEAQTAALIKQNMILRDNIALKMKAGTTGPMPAPAPIAGGMSAMAIAAVGVALVGLGFGFKEAGKGVAFMAEAMKEMSVGQIIAMAAPIAALGLSMKALAVGLIAVTPTATGAAPALAAVSLPILAIGAAVGIAAGGIGLLAEGLAKMFTAIELDKMVGFGVFVFALVKGTPFMVAAGFGLGAMAVGMGLLSLALFTISTKDLEAIATFTESLASVTTSQMKELADTIKAVAEAMDEIPVKKAMIFDTIMKQTAVTAATVAGANQAARATGTNTATSTSTNNSGRGKIGEVLIKFDTDLFENKVINIYEEQDGIKAREAMRNEG